MYTYQLYLRSSNSTFSIVEVYGELRTHEKTNLNMIVGEDGNIEAIIPNDVLIIKKQKEG